MIADSLFILSEVKYCQEWKVENFLKNNPAMISPPFIVGMRTKWFLQLKYQPHIGRDALKVSLVYCSPTKEFAKYIINVHDLHSAKPYQDQQFSSSLTEFCHDRRVEFIVKSSSELHDNKREVFKLLISCEIILNESRNENELLFSDVSLLFDTRFTDFVFTVDNKDFKVHKVLLAAKSDVFCAMFTTESMCEYNDNRAIITDISAQVFEALIQYMYTGKIGKSLINIVHDLLIAADKYNVKGLKKLCEGTIIDGLNIDNCINTLLNYELFSLIIKKKAIEKIINNFNLIIKKEGWTKLMNEKQSLVSEIHEAISEYLFN